MPSSSSYKSSTNNDEIRVFNNLSSGWWNIENGPVKSLHDLNKFLAADIVKCTIDAGLAKSEFGNNVTPLKGVLLLDVGCGGGIMSEELARTGTTVVGLDLASNLLEVAKEHASLDSSLTNLTYVLQSVEEHSLENAEKYDVVVTSSVLEHVDNPDSFLEACARCLKPGGLIFVSTFNKTFMAWLLGIIAVEYILRMAPVGMHHYNKFVALRDVEDVLEKNKCIIKDVRGLFKNFFTGKPIFIKNTSIYYHIHAVKQ